MRELAGELGCPAHLLTTWGRLCWCAIGEDHDEHAFAVDEDDLGDPEPVGWEGYTNYDGTSTATRLPVDGVSTWQLGTLREHDDSRG